MAVRKTHRSGAYAGPEPGHEGTAAPTVVPAVGDHDVEVTEADISGSAFSIDLVIGKLLEEQGIEVVRSSPFQEARQMGRLSGMAQHKLVFRTADGEAVVAAFRDAGII